MSRYTKIPIWVFLGGLVAVIALSRPLRSQPIAPTRRIAPATWGSGGWIGTPEPARIGYVAAPLDAGFSMSDYLGGQF